MPATATQARGLPAGSARFVRWFEDARHSPHQANCAAQLDHRPGPGEESSGCSVLRTARTRAGRGPEHLAPGQQRRGFCVGSGRGRSAVVGRRRRPLRSLLFFLEQVVEPVEHPVLAALRPLVDARVAHEDTMDRPPHEPQGERARPYAVVRGSRRSPCRRLGHAGRRPTVGEWGSCRCNAVPSIQAPGPACPTGLECRARLRGR